MIITLLDWWFINMVGLFSTILGFILPTRNILPGVKPPPRWYVRVMIKNRVKSDKSCSGLITKRGKWTRWTLDFCPLDWTCIHMHAFIIIYYSSIYIYILHTYICYTPVYTYVDTYTYIYVYMYICIIHSCNPLATLAIPQECLTKCMYQTVAQFWMKTVSPFVLDAEACPDVPGNQTRGGENDVATLWWTNILPWKITIFNGKVHYFYGHFPLVIGFPWFPQKWSLLS